MTYFVSTIRGFIFGHSKVVDADPVHHFFFGTSSGDKKKVYNRALKKAQADQERITKEAQAKV